MRRRIANTKADAFGLLACGSAGTWDISIDETIAGRARWFARIESPSLFLQFEIPSPTVVARALRFLDKPRQFRRCLRIGTADRRPVTLVWDDEFADRCFLVIGALDQPISRLTLDGEELAKIKLALRQAHADLQTERQT